MSAQYGVAMSWQQYVGRHLVGKPQSWLASEVGVNPGTVSRWTRGEQTAEANMVIKVARAVGDEPLAALVAAGFLTPDEAGATVVAEPDYSQLSNDDLLELVRDRMREAGTADDAAPIDSARTPGMGGAGAEGDGGLTGRSLASGSPAGSNVTKLRPGDADGETTDAVEERKAARTAPRRGSRKQQLDRRQDRDAEHPDPPAPEGGA